MSPPREVWFVALVWSELLVQLPFFFVATVAFLLKQNWIRIPSLIYGSFVCATMVPILATLSLHTGPGYAREAVLLMYLPYAILPALLVGIMALNEKPFHAASSPSLLHKKLL